MIISFFYLLIYPILLFLLSGDWRWAEGWIFSIVFCSLSFSIVLYLSFKDPALLGERFGSPFQKEQKSWDKILLVFVMLGFLTWFVVLFAALAENTFAAPVVKIQKERGQKVISTGVYAIVRHPMYLGGTLLFAGAPLLLGSIYGLAAGVLLTVIIALRSVGEEKMLARELDGYDNYMKRVKWRLIPFVF